MGNPLSGTPIMPPGRINKIIQKARHYGAAEDEASCKDRPAAAGLIDAVFQQFV